MIANSRNRYLDRISFLLASVNHHWFAGAAVLERATLSLPCHLVLERAQVFASVLPSLFQSQLSNLGISFLVSGT